MLPHKSNDRQARKILSSSYTYMVKSSHRKRPLDCYQQFWLKCVFILFIPFDSHMLSVEAFRLKLVPSVWPQERDTISNALLSTRIGGEYTIVNEDEFRNDDDTAYNDQLFSGLRSSSSPSSSSTQNPIEEKYLRFLAKLPSVRRYPLYGANDNDVTLENQIKLETGNEWKPSEYLPWSGKMKYFVNSVDDHVKSDSDNYDKFVDSDGISVKYRGFSPNFQIKDAILKSTNDFPSGSWRRWKSAFLDEYPVKKFKSIRPISPAALLTGTRFKLYNQNHNQFGQDKASSSFPSTSMDLQKMLSKISPDEKGCKTIVKEIHESPGNEPQKIIRVIRNRRIDDDYRKSANKKGITLLMFKHCVEPNQTADSPNSISMKPILSTEQFNFEDSLKNYLAPFSKSTDHYWDDEQDTISRDVPLASIVDKDDEVWRDNGLISRQPIKPTKSSNENWPHVDGLTGFKPSNLNFQNVNRFRDQLLNRLLQQNNNLKISHPTNAYDSESSRRPKVINTSISYFERSKPAKSTANNHGYSVRYGNEDIETFSEDYDSDRYGPQTRKKAFIYTVK